MANCGMSRVKRREHLIQLGAPANLEHKQYWMEPIEDQ